MQDIVELERRITAAMERITKGAERLLDGAAVGDEAARIAHLTEALDEERMTNAQLNERLRVLRDAPTAAPNAVAAADPAEDSSAELAALQAQLAGQSDEIATLRRVLAEAGREISALRAARADEAEEAAEILAALDPLVRAALQENPDA